MSRLKRFTATVGIGCALAGVALPVASAAAATPNRALAPISLGMPFMSNLPTTPATCGANQGLFPGFLNFGPTGPLGPLGPHGPLGNSANLPCGLSAFNLGPTGPLGPGGALGTVH
jgi:hypothetical protein